MGRGEDHLPRFFSHCPSLPGAGSLDRAAAGLPRNSSSFLMTSPTPTTHTGPCSLLSSPDTSAAHPKYPPAPSTRASPVPPFAILNENHEFSLNTQKYCKIVSPTTPLRRRARSKKGRWGAGKIIFPAFFLGHGEKIPELGQECAFGGRQFVFGGKLAGHLPAENRPKA